MSWPLRGLYTIPPGQPFLRDLAEGVVARFHHADDPLSLAAVTIFLPTRRAERTLKEEIVRAAGVDALVMPAIRVLGDVDEDEGHIDAEAELGDLPPAVGRLERELILGRMLDEKRAAMGSAGGFAVSLALARSLARLIDDAANEDGDLSGIADLAPADLAQHWEATVALLRVGTVDWPEILDGRGLMDPAQRRSHLIRHYAERLAATRPTAPFIVAGSSGSVKATADLMAAIAGLPNGAIVLDGLDTTLDGETWDQLIPSHPQFALKELLVHLGADRSEAGAWVAGTDDDLARRRLFLSEAMRPPETADRWSERERLNADAVQLGSNGLNLIEAANEREEALAIAVAMREALESEGRTVALVTPDRMLARRTAAELRRWGIEADDSAGTPLAKTEAGALADLAVQAAACDGTPVALLSLLKHPRVALGGVRRDVLGLARRLERKILRPMRVTGGFEDIRQAVAGSQDTQAGEMSALVNTVEAALRPLCDLRQGAHGHDRLVAAHMAALEALTRDGEGRASAWRGPDGEAAFALLQEFARAQPIAMRSDDYAIAFDSAARTNAVRPQRPRHPRVSILGPLEARMQSADLMILGGLNEGVWPGNPADDPWLSRPMRASVKLSAPERRIGLSAHDFATLAAQPAVLLTRAKRREGAPSNPSRFLLRLTALAEGLGQPIAAHGALEIARRLDAAERTKPAPRPMPRPPVSARPRTLSVTRIETWVRDPYAIYAERVLKLRRLDSLAQPRDARDRGMMIHAAVEAFSKRPDGAERPLEVLLECGRAAFESAWDDPDVRAFWWPRFERAAGWLAERELDWREDRIASEMEIEGKHHYADIDFTLTGTPDRIDRRASGGTRVIDYKTGGVPTKKQANAGMAPQLPLLAAMARAGAFGPGVQDEPGELLYAQLGGGKVEGKLTALDDPAALTDLLEEKLKARVRQFDNPDMPYTPRVAPEKQGYEGDYDHLSRLDEWGDTGEAEA